jgi:hypothetical protein
MTNSATLRRDGWSKTPSRRAWTEANRKRGNHLELNKWSFEQQQSVLQRAILEMERRIRESDLEIKKAIAAYQAAQQATVIGAATELNSQSESVVNVFHSMRLYTGMALLGAIIGGLAFSWTGHRELAQLMGGATAVLACLIASRVTLHGNQP